MSAPGEMLPGQMSQWQLKSVLDVPRNLLLKFCQNLVDNWWESGAFVVAVAVDMSWLTNLNLLSNSTLFGSEYLVPIWYDIVHLENGLR